jgi:hypothetical protein
MSTWRAAALSLVVNLAFLIAFTSGGVSWRLHDRLHTSLERPPDPTRPTVALPARLYTIAPIYFIALITPCALINLPVQSAFDMIMRRAALFFIGGTWVILAQVLMPRGWTWVAAAGLVLVTVFVARFAAMLEVDGDELISWRDALIAASWIGAGVFVHAWFTSAWTIGTEEQFAYLARTMTCWCVVGYVVLGRALPGTSSATALAALSIVAGNLVTIRPADRAPRR